MTSVVRSPPQPPSFGSRPACGTETLVWTSAGILGCAGLHAAGIGVVINKVTPDDGRPGVPYPFIVRKILQQTRLSDALQAVLSAHRASGVHYLLSDASGIMASVETSATDARVLEPDEPVYVHTNHYLAPAMQAYETRRRSFNADSLYRHRRARDLVRGRLPLSTEDVMGILRDHAGGPGSICRHNPGNDPCWQTGRWPRW